MMAMPRVGDGRQWRIYGDARIDLWLYITPAGGVSFIVEGQPVENIRSLKLPVEARLPLLRFLLEDAKQRGEHPWNQATETADAG